MYVRQNIGHMAIGYNGTFGQALDPTMTSMPELTASNVDQAPVAAPTAWNAAIETAYKAQDKTAYIVGAIGVAALALFFMLRKKA